VALFLCCHRRRGARQSSRIAAGIAPSAPVPPMGRGPPGAPRQHSSSAQRDARGPRGAGAAGERRAQRSPAAASARAVSAQQGPFADALASFETRAPVVRAGDPTRPASGQKVNKSNQSGPPSPWPSTSTRPHQQQRSSLAAPSYPCRPNFPHLFSSLPVPRTHPKHLLPSQPSHVPNPWRAKITGSGLATPCVVYLLIPPRIYPQVPENLLRRTPSPCVRLSASTVSSSLCPSSPAPHASRSLRPFTACPAAAADIVTHSRPGRLPDCQLLLGGMLRPASLFLPVRLEMILTCVASSTASSTVSR